MIYEADIPIYGGTLVVILESIAKNVKKYIKNFNKTEVGAHTWHREWKGKEGLVIILNPKKLTHGSVAHEALHAADFLADDRGFVPDFNNDEPVAYLIAWIVDEVYHALEKKNIKL